MIGRISTARIDGPLYEYACHEGNDGLPSILKGARRAEEKSGVIRGFRLQAEDLRNALLTVISSTDRDFDAFDRSRQTGDPLFKHWWHASEHGVTHCLTPRAPSFSVPPTSAATPAG